MANDDRMFKLMRKLEDDELMLIWNQALKRKESDKKFKTSSRKVKLDLISAELRSVAGHTIVNVFRGAHDLSWKQILVDVADKLKPGMGWTDFKKSDDHSESHIEDTILKFAEARTKEAWEKLPTEKRQEFVDELNGKLETGQTQSAKVARNAALKKVSVDGMTTAITTGLLTGGGAVSLLGGTLIGSAAGGLLVGSFFGQIGLWLVVELFGWWAGFKLVFGGGAAWLGGAVVGIPAAVAGGLIAAMAPSYAKTIPAVLLILSSVLLHEQLEEQLRQMNI